MAAIPEDKLSEIQQMLAEQGYVDAVFGRAQKVGELRLVPVVAVDVALSFDGEGESAGEARATMRPIGMVVVSGDEASFRPLACADELAREALESLRGSLRQEPRREERHEQPQGQCCEERHEHHHDRRHEHDRDGRRERHHDRRHEHRHDERRGDRPPGSGWGPLGEALALLYRAFPRR